MFELTAKFKSRKKTVGIIWFLLLSGTFFSKAQESKIAGEVVDHKNKPIPYANIILRKYKAGAFSDESGKFELNVSELMDDDLLEISCIGYAPVQLIVKEFKNQNKRIVLKENVQSLKEVVVNAKKLKTFTRGKTRTNTNLIRYGSSFREEEWNEPGHEMGRRFRLGTKKISYLRELSFFIKENSFDQALLGIHIYTVKDKKPDRHLNTSNLVVSADNRFTGWKTIDLRDYDIRVQEDIIVTIEFIRASPFCYYWKGHCGLYLTYIYPTISTPPMYSKDGFGDEWEIRKGESLAMILTYQQ